MINYKKKGESTMDKTDINIKLKIVDSNGLSPIICAIIHQGYRTIEVENDDKEYTITAGKKGEIDL